MFKKYLLFFSIIFICFCFLYIPLHFQSNVVNSSITKAKEVNHVKTLQAQGKLQSQKRDTIELPVPILPSQVYVNVGQQVEKGEKLFSIDTNNLDQQLDKVAKDALTNPSLLMGILGSIPEIEDYESLKNSIQTDYYANTSGIITELNLEPNTLTNPMMPLISISPMEHIMLNVDIPPTEINKIQAGQKVSLSLPLGRDTAYTGKVVTVNNIAKNKLIGTKISPYIQVVAEVDNLDGEIIMGLEGEVTIFYGEEEKIRTLPYHCINQDEKGEFVYLLTRENKVQKKYITTGEDLNGETQILQGIGKDDMIIKEPEKVSRDHQYVVVK